MMLVLTAALTFAYAVLAFTTAVFARRASIAAAGEPDFVSVLVAARNEEQTLAGCLEALLEQSYPKNRYEILVADDQSDDGTAEIPSRFNVRCIRMSGEGSTGKPGALHVLVGAAKSELLLVTDADCRPPRDWLANLSAQLREDVAGIACGTTVVTGSSLVARVQALDWLLLSSVAAGFSEMGVPVTAMGNNMAFRREAYENVGGYAALPFSVTEDYVLFKAIGRSKKWHARLILHPAVLNTTLPVKSWREMFSQRKRWARGGLRAGPGMYSLYMLIFLTHASLLILLFANPPAGLLLIASKAAIDAFVVRSAARHLGFHPSFAAFPAFEAYLFTYIASMPFVLALSPKIRWKGRRH